MRRFNFSNINKRYVLHSSKFIEDKKPIKNLSLVEKFELLTLVRFYDNSLSFVNLIAKEYKKNIENYDISNFIDNFASQNKDFNLTNEEIIEIFRNNFIVTEDKKINLESFFNFFSRKFSIKISVEDFLNISLKGLILLFGTIESKLENYFTMHAAKGMIYYTEFNLIFKIIFAKSENKWKTLEYFR